MARIDIDYRQFGRPRDGLEPHSGLSRSPDTRRELVIFQKETSVPCAVVPSKSLVGAFTEHGDRIFWDVHDPEQAVTINLQHDTDAKLIVDVTDRQAMVQTIQQRLNR